ncbi:MAG: AsmA family protein [Gallionella sp.]
MKAIKNALLGLYGVIGLLISTFGLFKLPFSEQLAREHYRYAIGGVLIILLILPVAIGVFILSFNANNFKDEIVQYVKTHTQRDLVLQGDIKVTFFPKLGLESGKVLLRQRNSAREFAAVNNARLYIEWLPLLRKQLVFDHIEIDGARVNLIRYKDGTANYDDLLIRDETLSPVTFDIDSVHITNSTLNWQDEIKWQRVALQDMQIETGRIADTVPGNLKASFRLNSEKVHSDALIELKSRLFYDHKEARYEFADIDGTLTGTAAGFSNLALSFKGSVDSHPAQGSLLAENFVVSATGNYGQRSIVTKLSVPKLQLANGVWNGSQATLDASLSQFDEKWTTAAQMPAFEFANKIFKAAEFGVDFDFKGEGRTLQGRLSGPISMDFETTPKLQLGSITLNLSATHPMLSDGLSAIATGSVNADLSERNANLGFKAKIDNSEITGTLAVKDFSHPGYTFKLNANQIDLGRYISADWIKRYKNDAAQIDFSGLKDMNMSGSLNVGEIKMGKLQANKFLAGIKIEKSELTVAPLTAKLYGGSMTGSISAAAQATPQIAFKQNFKGVQVNALFADTSGASKLTGKADVALDIGAEGGSVGALRKSLNGSASLALARGSLAGIDMRAALIEGKDDLGVKSEARVHEAKPGEKTDFSDLKVTLDIKDGVSHGNSFAMRTPLFRVAGDGDVALDTGNIKYQLAATVSAALKRRSAGELAELKGVTVPVRVSGHWAAPSIALDFAAASGGIVTKQIAARIAAEQAAARKAAAEKAAVEPAVTKRTAPRKKRATKTIKK